MKIKINYHIFIIAFILVFFITYRFISIEPHLAWIIDKQEINNSISDKFYNKNITELKKQYFINNSSIVFYSNNGRIISRNKMLPGMLAGTGTGKNGLLLFYQNSDKIFYLSNNKGITWEYSTFSYPFMTLNNNIILLLTGENAGYGTLDANGKVIAPPKSSGMLLTSFDISSRTNFIIIGYADGGVKMFDETLTELWDRQFTASSARIVKKVSASPNGKYFAALTGLEPEYLTLMNKKGINTAQYLTGENRRRPVELKFSGNEKYLLEESGTGFRLYSIKKKRLILDKHLFPKQAGRQMISMDISHDGEFIVVSYRLDLNISAVELYDIKGVLFYRCFFEDETPFIAFSFDNYNFQVETKNKIYLYGL